MDILMGMGVGVQEETTGSGWAKWEDAEYRATERREKVRKEEEDTCTKAP